MDHRPPGRRGKTAVVSAALAALTLLLPAACSNGRNAGAVDELCGAGGSGPPSTISQGNSSPAAASGTRPTKLLVIVLENHSACDAARGMPHLAAMGRLYARAEQSYALAHPSLPNYLAIAGGSTFSIRDDKPPAKHPLGGQSVFGQLARAGKGARVYAEGMTRNCQRENDGRYAVKHNPWPYFTAPPERRGCLRDDVPAGSLSRGALHDDIAAGALPTFSLLIPDECNDAHDCSLGTADAWLRAWLGQILTGRDFRSARLAVVITFDEDDHHDNNRILTILLHPSLRGVTVSVRLDHFALSRAASRLAGAQPLRKAANSPDLLAAVGLGG